MVGAILGIHILISLSLVIVVLLQSGKGGGLAGAFGGAGGVGAVFGGQTAASFLTKATRYLAVGFMLTSLTMAFVVRGRTIGGAVQEGLESRGATPASAGGDVVPGEVEGLPGTTGAPQPALPNEGQPPAGDQDGAAPETGADAEGGGIPVESEGE
jgi:preprotein translocase subunit SecG